MKIHNKLVLIASYFSTFTLMLISSVLAQSSVEENLIKTTDAIYTLKASTIAFWGFLAIILVILAFSITVLAKIWSGEVRLNGIIAEEGDPTAADPDRHCGKASLSRFQFLLFTFVVAGLFLMLSIEAGTFIDIPANVLALLGISAGSYGVSKAIGKKKTEDMTEKQLEAQRKKDEQETETADRAKLATEVKKIQDALKNKKMTQAQATAAIANLDSDTD